MKSSDMFASGSGEAPAGAGSADGQPESGPGHLELGELIDVPGVQLLLERFYQLVGIPLAILDVKGKVLVGVGWQKVCTDFHRVHPQTRQHCLESDTELTVGVRAGECRLYRCRNQMWDIASPLLVGGQHVGNIFLGQFFFEEEPVDYEVFRVQARRYGFEEGAYLSALAAVPRVSREALNKAMAFLVQLAQMLSQASYSTMKLGRLLGEREELMASLRESEQRLNRAQEIAHLGSWELDLETNRLSWSDEVYRIFGLRPQEFGASYEAFLEAVHPEDRAAVDGAYSGSLREGRDTYEIEHRVVRKMTGEIRIVHEKCGHIRDHSGRIIRSVGMVQDITGRKRAEAEISRQNAVLQGINRVFQEALTCETEEQLGRACLEVAEAVTQSQFGFIAELSVQGQLTTIAVSHLVWAASQTKHFGGEGKAPVVFPICGIYGRVVQEGKGFFTNEPSSHPDSIGVPPGHPAIQAFLGAPLQYDGRTVGMVALANRAGGYRAEDLHALESLSVAMVQALRHKRAEGALQQAQAQLRAHAEELETTVAQRTAKLQESVAELEHFSYAITHDMRAPLRAMQGLFDVIEEECGGCQQASRQYFQRIQRASRRMDQLIVESLNYSKAVRQELPLEPVSLLELLRGLVESYPNLQPDQADIQIALDLPQVLGNEAALAQCFSNLLGNAVKFAKAGTKAQIRVWAQRVPSAECRVAKGAGQGAAAHSVLCTAPTARVRVWVEDNGIGIPKAFQASVFGMFQRAPGDREGTGIGLAIVRKIAQRLGGEVGVESEEGQGSRFWVELKAVSQESVS